MSVTLNRNYPALSTLTSIIVQRACAAMLVDGYVQRNEGASLCDYVEIAFSMYNWEEGTTGPREQVMIELEFLGFAW